MATTGYKQEQDKCYYRGTDTYYNLMFTKGKAYLIWGTGDNSYCISNNGEKVFLMEDNLGLFMSLEPLEDEKFLPFQEIKTDVITKGELIDVIERLENYPCSMSCYVTVAELQGAQRMKDTLIKLIKEELL